MIKAYTFDAPNLSGQLQPYDARVDARIRRDLFFGAGDLIISGDRDGDLKKSGTYPSGYLGGSITFKVGDHVSFISGGRLFTMPDEEITVSTTQTGDVAVGSFTVTINTEDASGEYVKLGGSYYDGQDWEGTSWVSKYTLLFTSTYSGINVYVAPHQSGVFNAGGTMTISNSSRANTSGSVGAYRGGFVSDGDLRLTKVDSGRGFTMVGKTYLYEQYGDLVFGSKYSSPATIDFRGQVTIYANGWCAIGDVETVGYGSYAFRVTNIKTVAGERPPVGTQAHILTSLEGSIAYG